MLLFGFLVLQSSRMILLRLLLLYSWIEVDVCLAVVVASSSLRLDFFLHKKGPVSKLLGDLFEAQKKAEVVAYIT